MNQFVIRAFDYIDEEAFNRRMVVREQHLTRMKEEKAKGVFILGGALLDENKKMIGSVIILSLPDEESVANWIQQDQYVTGKVWNEISISPFRVADV